jgi:glutathione S-transferase
MKRAVGHVAPLLRYIPDYHQVSQALISAKSAYMLFPYVPRMFVRVTVTLPERDSYDALSRLEHQLESRQYLAGVYTLADIARAGNFHRLGEK